MIEQYFIVDDDIPILKSTPKELSERVKTLLNKDANVSRSHSRHQIDAVETYRISGEGFIATVDAYPPGWDINTPFGSGRRMVRVAFQEGDYRQFYSELIEYLGIFDKVVNEITATYGIHARVLPLFDSSQKIVAILIDREPYTPFKVNPRGMAATFPAYGIFVRTSREMRMFREALRTHTPSGKLLDIAVHNVH